jgi:kynurenine formamidase
MSADPVAGLIEALADGSVRVVDLTQPLSESTPVLKLPEPFANTPPLARRSLSRYDDAGPGWAWDVLELGEHTGTHLDAPIHWITGRDGEDVAAIAPRRLVGPRGRDRQVRRGGRGPGLPADRRRPRGLRARAWRDAAGLLGAVRTGWDARASTADSFLNIGPDGPVTPGPDVEAARWLATRDGIVGFGVETVGIDAGAAGSFDPMFPVHHFLLGSGRYGVTQLANLGELPPTGAVVVVAPLKLVGGTGSPVRALALVPAW